MKELLWIKRTDLALQVLALIAPLLLILGSYSWALGVYFAVGGVQVLSCLAHLAVKDASWIASGRRSYGRVVLITLLLAALVMLTLWMDINDGSFTLIIGFAYLIVTPFFAVWYFILCLTETDAVRRLAGRKTAIVK
jgi:hypothetical protein